MIPCRWIIPTTRAQVSLRRYTRAHSAEHWHNTRYPLDVREVEWYHSPEAPRPEVEYWRPRDTSEPGHDDPRWPKWCECGYRYAPEDEWQLFWNLIYTDPLTGEEWPMDLAPVGSIWEASYLKGIPAFVGPDGRALMVRTPGGDWHIDGPASNCARPQEPEAHKCWVRHGEPPRLTVDKQGETCQAGGGSILIGGYHGFLRDGHLVTA